MAKGMVAKPDLADDAYLCFVRGISLLGLLQNDELTNVQMMLTDAISNRREDELDDKILRSIVSYIDEYKCDD